MSVLILGATSPIARAVAEVYAQNGHPVFVAARDEAESARIAADLNVRFQVRTGSGFFDAVRFETHAPFLEGVESELGPVDVLFLAFGEMGVLGDERDFSDVHRVIDVNYTGAVSMCEAVAERMIARRSGTIVGVSSVAGDRGRQSNYIYGSAKGAFTLYLQGLRNRCFKHDVHVMTVKLGFVDTRMTFGMETAIPIATPEQAAHAIERAASRRENELYYPRFWRGIMGVIKTIPENVFKRLNL
jgi:NAD(P)-dependent dehydrogenase (short-subunit alcohol dehydrogenase family)